MKNNLLGNEFLRIINNAHFNDINNYNNNIDSDKNNIDKKEIF